MKRDGKGDRSPGINSPSFPLAGRAAVLLIKVRIPLVQVFSLCAGLVALAPVVSSAEISLVYRQRTGSREDRIEMSEEALPQKAELRIAFSSGETYHITSDEKGDVTACSFAFPKEGTSWEATRNGDTLQLAGTVKGSAVTRTLRIDNHPWYESAERSLQSYAVSASREPLRFWMIEPYTGSAFLMGVTIERREPVDVNGRSMEAVRLVMKPQGILALFWNTTYWFRPHDGTFLRSQSIGILSRAAVVVELVEDHRASP